MDHTQGIFGLHHVQPRQGTPGAADSVDRAAIERVAEDSGVKIGGELFSDAMGAAGSPEGTYIGMVRHNMELVVNALSDPS